MVASQPAGHYTDRRHKYTETVCAEPSKFKFTLRDSYGDGVYGRIKVEKDGATVFDKHEHAGRFSSKTEYFGECVTASGPSQSCITGSQYWEESYQEKNYAINLKQMKPMTFDEALWAYSDIPNPSKRRRAKNSSYSFGKDTAWSGEQEQWVKKMLAMATFETCRRKRKGTDFLIGSCPDGYYNDRVGACWRSCPEWMVSCGTTHCARDTGMCAKKVVDM